METDERRVVRQSHRVWYRPKCASRRSWDRRGVAAYGPYSINSYRTNSSSRLYPTFSYSTWALRLSPP